MSKYIFEDTKKHKTTIKKVKLNYKVDTPTINNRIYRKDELIKALDKLYEKSLIPIVRNSSELSEGIVRIKDMIGMFTGYEITPDNEIFINVRPVVDTDLFDNNYLSTNIVGTIREDNSVNISEILGFFIAGNHDVVDKDFNIVESNKLPRHELIILTGNIGCGKSTFALKKIEENPKFIIVNDDAISTMIGGIYTNYDDNKKLLYKDIELICVCIGLNNGFNVIVDMPNMKRNSRKRFIEIGKKFDTIITSIDWGRGSIEDLYRRENDNRGYNKWNSVFYKKFEEYEEPSLEEGFDEIIRMDYYNWYI